QRQWLRRAPCPQPPPLPQRQCWTWPVMSVAAAASPMAAPPTGAAETLEVPTRATPIAISIANKMARIRFSCVRHISRSGVDDSPAPLPPQLQSRLQHTFFGPLRAGNVVGPSLIVHRWPVHPLFMWLIGATDRAWANK